MPLFSVDLLLPLLLYLLLLPGSARISQSRKRDKVTPSFSVGYLLLLLHLLLLLGSAHTSRSRKHGEVMPSFSAGHRGSGARKWAPMSSASALATKPSGPHSPMNASSGKKNF